MILLFRIAIVLVCINFTTQSAGDKSPFYQKCLEKCNINNCSTDGLLYKSKYKQSIILQLLQWTCNDECCYECMWQTVSVFQNRNWEVPQFYGKWPFYRILGLQEPASVLFSLLNLYMHLKMITKFRHYIKFDYPLWGVWHFYTIVCTNAWIWSSVFHARDTQKTELLDYSCACSIVLVSCYCMLFRVLYKAPQYVLTIMTTFFVALFFNHVLYLTSTGINYGYNMQFNIAIGGITAMGWFIWSIWNRHRQPYTWKCAAYVSLTALSTLLEVIDRPPVFFILDFHALWHLCNVPLIWILYNFLIDDCTYLKKMEKHAEEGLDEKKA